MHILHVVGARPNFMKAAPVLRALRAYPEVRQSLVHTGQHYDAAMSDVFFQQLGMPAPTAISESAPAPTLSKPPLSCRHSSPFCKSASRILF